MSSKNPFLDLENRSSRFFLLTLFLIIGLYIIATSYFWWSGSSNIIDWNIISSLEETSSIVSFETTDGLLLKTEEPLFYIKKKYVPTGSIVSPKHSLLYLFGVLIGISLILSGTLRLKSLWFLSGIGVLGVILSSFNLELVFNQLNKSAFLICFFGVAMVAYLFNSWLKKNSINRTFPVFVLLFAIFCVVIQQYSKVTFPYLSITSSSVATSFLIACFFIFFLSHEIISVILKVTSSSTLGNKNSLIQFVIASSIYLLNTLLIYFENANKFSDSSAIIDPWWLLIISFVAGFWGFRQFCNQTQIMSFSQSGVWLYLGGGFITFASISYLYVTDNNPLIELLADFISISHLVVGIAFFGHVIINFIQPLQQNLAVHKILYKPPFSRLLLARLVAVFGIFILFTFKNYYSLNQFLAGYYNSLGDYSLAANELFVAETYYKKSVGYDANNHKGNYALASLAQSQGDYTTAGFYFKNALKKQPSAYAYVGLSESLLQAGLYFDATFNLRNGINVFPKDNHLSTNLSQQYAQSSIIDSTFLFANMAYENCNKCEVETANLLSFWLENAKPERLDSIYNAFSNLKGTSILANKTAIRKKEGKPTTMDELIINSDSILNVSHFSLLYNYVTNPENESKISDSELSSIQNRVENTGYFNDLLFMRAKNCYLFGNKNKAFEQLGYLTRDETTSTKVYDLTAAGWYLNEGLYDKSLNAFYKANDTLSIRNLQLADYSSKVDKLQLAYSDNIPNESISLLNYSSVLEKAPYNPYVVERIVNMLISNNQLQNAYNVVFNAVQVNTESLKLWKKYTTIALKNGLNSYADDGLKNVKRLSEESDYKQFEETYNATLLEQSKF